MPDHEWNGLPSLLCKRYKLRCKLAHHISVEGHEVCGPNTKEDREQQWWIFGRFSERFRSLDELARLFNRYLGFRRRIAFGVHESVYQPDLKLDLLATQR